jgi:hypothetical protein
MQTYINTNKCVCAFVCTLLPDKLYNHTYIFIWYNFHMLTPGFASKAYQGL